MGGFDENIDNGVNKGGVPGDCSIGESEGKMEYCYASYLMKLML